MECDGSVITTRTNRESYSYSLSSNVHLYHYVSVRVCWCYVSKQPTILGLKSRWHAEKVQMSGIRLFRKAATCLIALVSKTLANMALRLHPSSLVSVFALDRGSIVGTAHNECYDLI